MVSTFDGSVCTLLENIVLLLQLVSRAIPLLARLVLLIMASWLRILPMKRNGKIGIEYLEKLPWYENHGSF